MYIVHAQAQTDILNCSHLGLLKSKGSHFVLNISLLVKRLADLSTVSIVIGAFSFLFDYFSTFRRMFST